MHADLHVWDKQVLKGPRNRINEFKRELENLQRVPMSECSIAQQNDILLKLEGLFEPEETRHFQRGRANWLLQGDCKTSFFSELC